MFAEIKGVRHRPFAPGGVPSAHRRWRDSRDPHRRVERLVQPKFYGVGSASGQGGGGGVVFRPLARVVWSRPLARVMWSRHLARADAPTCWQNFSKTMACDKDIPQATTNAQIPASRVVWQIQVTSVAKVLAARGESTIPAS